MKTNGIKRLGYWATLYVGLLLSASAYGQILSGQGLSCGASATSITTLQRLPQPERAPNPVEVEATVTAVFDELRGFFLMESKDEAHFDNVSRGIFVYTGRKPVAVAAGDRLRVRGRVTDYYEQRQIQPVAVTRCAAGQDIEPMVVTFPLPPADQRQHWQSMWVTLPQPLTVIDHYNLLRFGSFVVAASPQQIPTQIMPPGAEAKRKWQQQDEQRLIIDDGSHRTPALPVPYPAPKLTSSRTLRLGDTVDGVTGILAWSFNQWRLHPTAPPRFLHQPRPAALPSPADGQIRLATFNVENYFSGRSGFPTARGARSAQQLQWQEKKLAAALRGIQADIIALAEVENNGLDEQSAIARLTRLLGDQWHYARPPGNQVGSDAISVAVIYRADRVQQRGQAKVLTDSPFNRHSRVPLAATFQFNGGQQSITVVANHFKAKTGCPSDQLSPDWDQDDGQGCWNSTRTQSARALVPWVQKIQRQHDASAVALMGDFNAYAQEDPIRYFQQQGFSGVLDPTSLEQITYGFRGRLGTLDYILINGDQSVINVERAGVWDINAREPRALGYASADLDASLLAPTPYRSSDHNPVWADIRMSARTAND